MKRCQLWIFGFASLMVLAAIPVAEAHGSGWSVGIRIGGPYYARPYGGYYAAPYYYAPRVIYAPPPVVYAAPPVVYAPAPIVVRQPAYSAEYTPAPTVVPVPASNNNAPAPAPVIPAHNETTASASSQQGALMARLNDASETVRRDAALDLGRAKAQSAVDPLMTLLAKDASPMVRDAAARGLGLIASPRSLNALIYAAQADNDRDVRHSAQFAVEIIRTNLRGN